MGFREWIIFAGLVIIAGLITDAIRRIIFQRRFNDKITFGLEQIKMTEGDYYSELPNGGARIKQGSADENKSTENQQTEKEYEQEQCKVNKTAVAPVLSVYEAKNKNTVTNEKLSDNENNYVHNVMYKVKAAMQQQKVMHDVQIKSKEHAIIKTESKPVILKFVPTEKATSPDTTFKLLHDDPITEKQKYDPFSIISSDSTEHAGDTNEVKQRESTIFTKGQSESMQSDIINNKKKNQSYQGITDDMIKVDESSDECIQNEINNGNVQIKKNYKIDDFSKISSEEALIMYLKPEPGQLFSGESVLQTLLDNGLRMGKMNIFHYIRREDHQHEEILFSVANGMEPGFFDLTTMQKENFRALSLFILLANLKSPVEALKTMMRVTDAMSKQLYAQVYDDQHCRMTLQILEYYRSKAEEYQLKNMLS
ncbi:MAG: cell division protein ZipA C-terminal FtsZ-binding domain-containing protein [Endozoicomonadaceae bacterium]|nr:cell division protein ZipA C-terminal FtsZ-binding domain-containing protein [Endozoicomonadaceae bacterium]MCY4329041.1 cell division protein ZipA C-terminal FtsZ-binding domain-containing protein [Endozoicomonadaceae bacterium]